MPLHLGDHVVTFNLLYIQPLQLRPLRHIRQAALPDNPPAILHHLPHHRRSPDVQCTVNNRGGCHRLLGRRLMLTMRAIHRELFGAILVLLRVPYVAHHVSYQPSVSGGGAVQQLLQQGGCPRTGKVVQQQLAQPDGWQIWLEASLREVVVPRGVLEVSSHQLVLFN